MRDSRDVWALKLALVTAQRGTCIRRQVGCVLLSARGHVLGTGYNGVAAGLPHCNHQELDFLGVPSYPHACSGATAVSGTNLDLCQAIHAEQNALLQCRDVYAIETAAVTVSPCITCTKLLLNTSCQRIIYITEYPHHAAHDLWRAAGREWIQQYAVL